MNDQKREELRAIARAESGDAGITEARLNHFTDVELVHYVRCKKLTAKGLRRVMDWMEIIHNVPRREDMPVHYRPSKKIEPESSGIREYTLSGAELEEFRSHERKWSGTIQDGILLPKWITPR